MWMMFKSQNSSILDWKLGMPYKNKYWRGTKFGELANRHAIAKFKSRQYVFSIAYQL